MANLLSGAPKSDTIVSFPTAPERTAPTGETPRRSVTLMRKYEVSALLPDLSISQKTHVAPASPLFEETAGAYARGTVIQTVRGPVAIEDLLPGDYIETDHGAEAVTWIGSTTYVPGVIDDNSTLTRLTRITAEGFGMARPMADLLLGPSARMVLRREKLLPILGRDKVLVPVQDYADGDRILSVEPGGAVQLFNLMLMKHSTIRIDGVEMDTYHPGRLLNGDVGTNMRALFLSMFPNITQAADFGELCMTRSSREVIDGLT